MHIKTQTVNKGGNHPACISWAGFKYQTATKITFAPAASVGAGFWSGASGSAQQPASFSASSVSLPVLDRAKGPLDGEAANRPNHSVTFRKALGFICYFFFLLAPECVNPSIRLLLLPLQGLVWGGGGGCHRVRGQSPDRSQG